MEYYEEELNELGHGTNKEKFYKWAKEDITILLQYYEDFVRNSVFSKRKLLWITLSKQLQEHGVPVDPVQCENKWKALCRAYRNQYKSFQYREIIERILSLNNTESSLVNFDKESHVSAKRQKIDHASSSTAANENESTSGTKSWRPEEVAALLNIWETNIQILSTMHKKTVYEKVAEQLCISGINVNALNVEHKWKGLLRALRRRVSQKQNQTETDIRVEKLYKLGLAYETEDLEDPLDDNSLDNMQCNKTEENTYHTLTNSKASTTSGILTLLRSSAAESMSAFPPQESQYDATQEYLDDHSSMDSVMPGEQSRSSSEILDENMTFEERLLRFLKEQEEAKERRHQEKMELKRKKIGLLEALVQSKNNKY